MADQVFGGSRFVVQYGSASLAPLACLRRVALVLAGAVVLMWAAFVNGGPFFHPDTRSYIRGPDVAVMKLLGPRFASSWAAKDVQVGRPAQFGPGGAPVRSFDDKEVLAGRSIYYGALAWLGEVTGGFWLTIFAQALAVAYLLDAMLRAAGRRSAGAYAAAAGLIAAATPAPFFVALVMPDIWAGVGLGALALLLTRAHRLRRVEMLALTGLLAFSALAHTSNLLLTASLLPLAPGLRWVAGKAAPSTRTGLLAGGAAICIAVAGGWLFAFAVTHIAKASPITPPFLTARLVADGTGARFLEKQCPRAGFEACRYRAQTPRDADDYLWSVEPRRAVFATAPTASRRALAAEQVRFALAVVASDPLGQVRASAHNVLVQLADSDLANFDYEASVRRSFDEATPAASLQVLQRTAAYRQLWPLGPLQAWYGLVLIAAILIILGWLGYSAVQNSEHHEPIKAAELRAFASILVLGLIANAAICGALSSPYGRYQARLDWLLPLTALLIMFWLSGRDHAARGLPR